MRMDAERKRGCSSSVVHRIVWVAVTQETCCKVTAVLRRHDRYKYNNRQRSGSDKSVELLQGGVQKTDRERTHSPVLV